MQGRIIRIISNLYTVEADNKTYECRARGLFRNKEITPLVGDIVEFNEENYILSINARKNELNRPMIANIDSAIIVTTCTRPEFSPFLLDKMLVNITLNNIDPIVCFSKYDLLDEKEQKKFDDIIDYYNSIGIKTIINHDIKTLEKYISGCTVVLTGQTGAGKSTLLNALDATLNLATDDISEALGRGKHTTRHVELFKVRDYYIADTPGFSALDVIDDTYNIRFAFPEFANDECKFRDCLHKGEKGCRVLEQVENGEILESRYDSYRKMVEK
ncbi:MAG: ribosome small subunit-dependent GTPase A [Bacilli bacterium]|nr:ribosome small subunit-dependent GTPase A [Bacilli bacterium]